MSNEDRKAAARRKLYPVEICKFNGVAIEVKPLRASEVAKAIDFLFDFFMKANSGSINREFLLGSIDTLYGYLNQCVSIPEDPDLTVEDLPFSALPDVIDLFLVHTLNPGNWQTRLQGWKEMFGVTVTLEPGVSP